jgi:hypothetical protein
VLGRDSKVTAAERKSKRAKAGKHESWRAFGTGAHFPIQPARRPVFVAFGWRLLLFADGRLQRSRIPPPQQIPTKWPLRKLLSALPRRTSPWAPRSARVRRPEFASSATRDHHDIDMLRRNCYNQEPALTICPSRRARLRRCPYLRLLQRHLRPRHRSLVRLNNTHPRVCEI